MASTYPVVYNTPSSDSIPPNSLLTSGSGQSLKRRASSPPQDSDQANNHRKRMKEGQSNDDTNEPITSTTDSRLIEELAQDLQCGCCAELVYKPVLVLPCQHFFCGSCCTLWIKNGGTNCPSCRGVSTIATPFRALQGAIDAFLRAAPHRVRTERERQQADGIYAGGNLRLPAPREASPEPNINQSTEFAHPCPHCLAGNPFNWTCPQPIPDPNLDPDHAWALDDGVPPGHGHCGNCESMLALRAPTTTKCDMCQVSFCGIHVQGRCIALPLLAQQPHGLTDIGDLIQSPYVYECFEGNTVEADIMLDYLTTQQMAPKHIYREIITYTQSQPRGFQPLIEAGLFSDIHGVPSIDDPNPDAPRNRICRLCAAEVFLYGLRDWWIRERQKGFLEERIAARKDCPEGSACVHLKDLGHAREFNHLIVPPKTVAEGSSRNPQSTPGPVAGSSSGSSIPNIPVAEEPLAFAVNVQGQGPRSISRTLRGIPDTLDSLL